MVSEEASFTLQDAAAGGDHTLLFRGELDMLAASEVDDVIAGLCAGPDGRITLDLRKLTFVDSTGLRAIVDASEACKRHGHELLIVPGPRNVQHMFALTGLLDRLPFLAADGDGCSPPQDAIPPRLLAGSDDDRT